MNRYCLALDLKDDPSLIAAYEAHHQAVWPEILASIREAGILDMQIYRTGNRLFMIMEVSDAFDAAAKSAAVFPAKPGAPAPRSVKSAPARASVCAISL